MIDFVILNAFHDDKWYDLYIYSITMCEAKFYSWNVNVLCNFTTTDVDNCYKNLSFEQFWAARNCTKPIDR